MDSQQIINLTIVLGLTLFLAIGARHELADWKAAALLFGGGAAVLVFCLLFSWAFEGISEFERGLRLRSSIGFSSASHVPLGYALLLTAAISIVRAVLRWLRDRN